MTPPSERGTPRLAYRDRSQRRRNVTAQPCGLGRLTQERELLHRTDQGVGRIPPGSYLPRQRLDHLHHAASEHGRLTAAPLPAHQVDRTRECHRRDERAARSARSPRTATATRRAGRTKREHPHGRAPDPFLRGSRPGPAAPSSSAVPTTTAATNGHRSPSRSYRPQRPPRRDGAAVVAESHGRQDGSPACSSRSNTPSSRTSRRPTWSSPRGSRRPEPRTPGCARPRAEARPTTRAPRAEPARRRRSWHAGCRIHPRARCSSPPEDR